MELTDLIARFRLETRDLLVPYLWSDEEIISYIDEAQKEFCRRTGGLADATSTECARVTATAGEAFADVSPKVLKIRAAFDSDGKRLDILNFEDLEFSACDPSELFSSTEGTVRAIVVGMEPNKIRLIKTPEETQTVSLIVYRLPLEDIEDESGDLEIDPQHHLSLLLWAKRLAHLKADAEAFDRGRADQYEKQFIEYCRMSTDERARREHKYRSVQFSYW